MTDQQDHSFAKFMIERLAASTAFVNGDVQPLHQISTRTSPANLLVQAARSCKAPMRSIARTLSVLHILALDRPTRST